MDNQIRLSTRIYKDGVIKQRIEYPHKGGFKNNLTDWMLDTREDHIKKALVELGWSPPEE